MLGTVKDGLIKKNRKFIGFRLDVKMKLGTLCFSIEI